MLVRFTRYGSNHSHAHVPSDQQGRLQMASDGEIAQRREKKKDIRPRYLSGHGYNKLAKKEKGEDNG